MWHFLVTPSGDWTSLKLFYAGNAPHPLPDQKQLASILLQVKQEAQLQLLCKLQYNWLKTHSYVISVLTLFVVIAASRPAVRAKRGTEPGIDKLYWRSIKPVSVMKFSSGFDSSKPQLAYSGETKIFRNKKNEQ